MGVNAYQPRLLTPAPDDLPDGHGASWYERSPDGPDAADFRAGIDLLYVPAVSSHLADAAAAYVPQLGAYALATEAATGRQVTEAWLVFSRRAAAGLDAEYRLPSVSDAAELAREAAVVATGR